MAYNYYPATYTPMVPAYYQPSAASYAPQGQMQQPAAQAPQQSGIVWVQGEAGAKSYLVAPNTTALLMDSEGERFYIKGADASGMPMPLRTFEYRETSRPTEQGQSYAQGDEYATKKDLDDMRRHVEAMLREIEGKVSRDA